MIGQPLGRLAPELLIFFAEAGIQPDVLPAPFPGDWQRAPRENLDAPKTLRYAPF
jgi:hypothetical protein